MSNKTNNKRIMFAKSKILEYPDLLEVQLKSFKDFFQLDTTPENRKDEGLYQVFQEIFPIEDTRNNYKLEFIDYFIDPPQYSIEECLDRGLTYSVPLKAKLRLSCTDPEHDDFDTRVQDVYLGNIPYMTPSGTFVINGSERIIVSQLHRSPGVFFDQTMHANGTKLYSARIIPFKGSWIEFATDISNVMYAYIDRKKKLPVTALLRATAFDAKSTDSKGKDSGSDSESSKDVGTDKDIINIFGLADEIQVNKKNLQRYNREYIEDKCREFLEKLPKDYASKKLSADLEKQFSSNVDKFTKDYLKQKYSEDIVKMLSEVAQKPTAKGKKTPDQENKKFLEGRFNEYVSSRFNDLAGSHYLAYLGQACPDVSAEDAKKEAEIEKESAQYIGPKYREFIERNYSENAKSGYEDEVPEQDIDKAAKKEAEDKYKKYIDQLAKDLDKDKVIAGCSEFLKDQTKDYFEKQFKEDLNQKYHVRKLAASITQVYIVDFTDDDSGEVTPVPRSIHILDRGEELNNKTMDIILHPEKHAPDLKSELFGDSDMSQIKVPETILLQKDDAISDEYAIIFNTLQKDPTSTQTEAMRYIYKQLRNVEPAEEDDARKLIKDLFFSEKRYDLGEVGRYRLDKKLESLHKGEHTSDADKKKAGKKEVVRVLTKDDIVGIIKYLVQLINSKASVDDIDHLSNRRVRTVGEQLANQFNVGLSRMARTIRERMNVRDSEQFNPIDLINAKTLSSVINSFFGTSQLSQFMDQTNPLAEITNKRRLSALGPGGLSRDRAGFEVRDVHYTHYGRLCPIESPEGPNIGLISSLCVYARINDLGFIETPYREVHNGKVDLSDSGWHYMTAEEEEDKLVSLANVPMDDDGTIKALRVQCRKEADFPVVSKEEVDYMDVAPNQMASVAASLIPFLEHDDAHRALMGANMMRQAVPLLNPEAPIVGTGLEERVCLDSRTQIRAARNGVVTYVDANEIRIKYDMTDDEKFVSFAPEETIYKLPVYRRTNQSTTVTLKPIVRKGDKVTEGQVLTEGYATQGGELALGRNLMVAFMPWKGYNYEDAVVLSEEMVKWDILTSIHVDEYLTEVRGTKRGPEELTSDIPNVSEDATKNLDKQGIIRVGAHVEPGDIMIGKITPKGESDPSPEEKLLKAIFGDKAGDVKDASLKANPSLSGTIIKTALYAKASKESNRKGAKSDQAMKMDAIIDDFNKKDEKLYTDFIKRLGLLTKGKKSNGISDLFGVELIPKGKEITLEKLKDIAQSYNTAEETKAEKKSESSASKHKEFEGDKRAMAFENINSSNWTKDKSTNDMIQELVNNYCITYKSLEAKTKRQLDMVKVGDELPNGVMQLAKVYIAKKRKITVGDKMAGRHGNKGCVAKIVRREDMPFLEDGTPVDIVLNPLGVPSRMNLGQIYETVLGWAGKKLGVKFSTPIFDGATNEEIDEYTKKAGLPLYGKTHLRDGGTGDWFDQSATVGVIYMLKLGHMVDDKMHARSIGPYSLITQQPLGGKAQFGGQRFGEMEVWALEAFGAANVLQEILTVKSDDVTGRAKTYEAIVKGDPMPTPGIPESLNVLLHELRGLGLKVTLE